MKIVIKIGTSSLTTTKKLDLKKFEKLTNQIIELNKNHEIIIVTSGAIGAGNGILNIQKKLSLSLKQACASVGQLTLMNTYNDFFKKANITIGQILLSKDDIENRVRNLNVKNNIDELLKLKVIPIINENDSVTIDEIKVGDNDNLAALVAILVDANLLILLSDINGIYTANPNIDSNAVLLQEITEITPKIKSYAKDKTSDVGTGGMITKLEAAEKVMNAGINMVIANSEVDNILLNIINDKFVGSKFIAKNRHLITRERWLLFGAKINGDIYIDLGAKEALIANKSSLLAVGIIDCTKKIKVGDVVNIVFQNRIIGRGISNYTSKDILKIKGLKTEEIIQNYLFKVIIHRDNLMLN